MALLRTSKVQDEKDNVGSLKKNFGHFMVPALAKNAVFKKIEKQNRTDSVLVGPQLLNRSTQFQNGSSMNG